jgi:hypothetical protein
MNSSFNNSLDIETPRIKTSRMSNRDSEKRFSSTLKKLTSSADQKNNNNINFSEKIDDSDS